MGTQPSGKRQPDVGCRHRAKTEDAQNSVEIVALMKATVDLERLKAEHVGTSTATADRDGGPAPSQQ